MREVLPFPLPDPGEIRRCRAQILAALLAADEGFCAVPVKSVRRSTLQAMLSLYDRLFFGGFLSRFLETGLKPEELHLSDAVEFARWGNAAAACCIQKRGAIPAMPGREELARWLR